MSLIRLAWERWEAWFFAPADDRNLALLRIGYGLLILWSYLPLWAQRQVWLGDAGLMPLDFRARWYGPSRLSVFALGQDPTWWLVAFYAVAVLLILGVFSRLSMALAWVGVVSICHRNGMWLDGSDAVLRVFGFYLLFLPLGRRWSVDALWRRFPGQASSAWALRLFQLNVCLLYLKTGWVKAPHGAWEEGTAVFYALAAPVYWRFPMEQVLASPVFQAFTTVATYGTLVFELGFFLVLVPRLRRWVLLAGLGLHLGIFFFLSLGAFSECILWTYLAFVALKPEARQAG